MKTLSLKKHHIKFSENLVCSERFGVEELPYYFLVKNSIFKDVGIFRFHVKILKIAHFVEFLSPKCPKCQKSTKNLGEGVLKTRYCTHKVF